MSRRDFTATVRLILDEFHELPPLVRRDLASLARSAGYMPPESQGELWGVAASILTAHVPVNEESPGWRRALRLVWNAEAGTRAEAEEKVKTMEVHSLA